MLTGDPAPQKFSEESLEFQRRISQRNGLSEETYLPPALHSLMPTVTMETAREEARMVLFGAVQDVLDRTGMAISCCALHTRKGNPYMEAALSPSYLAAALPSLHFGMQKAHSVQQACVWMP